MLNATENVTRKIKIKGRDEGMEQIMPTLQK